MGKRSEIGINNNWDFMHFDRVMGLCIINFNLFVHLVTRNPEYHLIKWHRIKNHT